MSLRRLEGRNCEAKEVRASCNCILRIRFFNLLVLRMNFCGHWSDVLGVVRRSSTDTFRRGVVTQHVPSVLFVRMLYELGSP